MIIKLEFNDKKYQFKDGKNLPDCVVLEAKTVVVGGTIGVIGALISLVGLLAWNKYILLAGYTGLIFGLGVFTAFDLGRKLGDKLVRRE